MQFPTSPAELQAVEAQTYQRMLAEYGLTMDEARDLIDAFKKQSDDERSRFMRAYQQAAQALAARLHQRALEKRSRTSP